jgi:uncharacterized protein YdaU (DUF1376 family)
MAEYPAFQFYPKDFLTDEAVAVMSDEELGFYFRCLCYAWLNDGLPADPDRLARVLGRTREHVSRMWQAVGCCWHIDLQRQDRLVNRRQEAQRAQYQSLSEERRNAANKRWHKDGAQVERRTRSKRITTAMQVHSSCNDAALQMDCSAFSILQTPGYIPEGAPGINPRWHGRSRTELVELVKLGTEVAGVPCPDTDQLDAEELCYWLDRLVEYIEAPSPNDEASDEPEKEAA